MSQQVAKITLKSEQFRQIGVILGNQLHLLNQSRHQLSTYICIFHKNASQMEPFD